METEVKHYNHSRVNVKFSHHNPTKQTLDIVYIQVIYSHNLSTYLCILGSLMTLLKSNPQL